jgi:hypothetical protein
MNTQTANLIKYQGLYRSLVSINEKLAACHNDELRLKSTLGFKKISVLKKFASIDRDILKLQLNNSHDSSNFFSDILNLETLRLKFKEEVSKCHKTQPQIKLNF